MPPHHHRPSPLQVHTPSTVATAPDRPGIYAWYGVPDLGVADWAPPDGDGSERLATALRRHSARHRDLPLDVSVQAGFSARFAGTLTDASYTDPSASNPADAAPVAGAMEDDQTRALLVALLDASALALAAPLYVGVTNSLRRRLREHVDGLYKLSAAAREHAGLRDRLLQAPRTFAARAVGKGFTPNHLRVVTLDAQAVSGPDYSRHQLSEAAEAAEWLLNRWHRPALGRS